MIVVFLSYCINVYGLFNIIYFLKERFNLLDKIILSEEIKKKVKFLFIWLRFGGRGLIINVGILFIKLLVVLECKMWVKFFMFEWGRVFFCLY